MSAHATGQGLQMRLAQFVVRGAAMGRVLGRLPTVGAAAYGGISGASGDLGLAEGHLLRPVLEALTIFRLVDSGSEWRLHWR